MEQVEASGAHWKREEVLALLSVWKEEDIFRDVQSVSEKKKPVYGVIAERLAGLGYSRTTTQIRNKIRRLKRDYKDCCRNNSTSGKARKQCDFFSELDDILGHRPAVNPPSGSVIETSEVATGKWKALA